MANKIIVMGRLTKDPELKTLQSGTELCTFSIAVDRKFKKEGQPTADFFNLIAFGKTGGFISTWFKKGKMIYVEGSLQNKTWEDTEGQKHYATEIFVDNAEFCGDKTGDNTNDFNNKPVQKPTQKLEEIEDDSDDSLPF